MMDRHFYRTVLLGACWLAFAANCSTAQIPVAQFDERATTEFPYVAFVSGRDAFVRSGPGQRHYPTGRLPAGSAVEVYRHDGDGWCAVRPPQGAYSLVAARQLRKIDDRTAEVIEDGAVARVGSSLSPQKNGVQVMLKQGELVQLLNPPNAGATRSDPDWTRIAPPTGEFRWIASAQISRQPPLEQQPSAKAFANRQSGLSLDSLPTLPASAAVRIPTAIAPPKTDSEAIEILPGSPAELQLAQYQPSPEQPAPANGNSVEPPPTYAQEASATTTPGHAPGAPPRIKFPHPEIIPPANPRIAELQVRLSREVVKPPKSWSLAALREETAVLLANEQQPPARDQYRDLLNRIAVFEQVQRRYATPPAEPLSVAALPNAAGAITPTPRSTDAADLSEVVSLEAGSTAGVVADDAEKLLRAGSDRNSLAHTSGSEAVLARIRTDLGTETRKPATVEPPDADPFEANAIDVAPTIVGDASDPAAEAKYDAVGTLKPVVSRRAGAPRYALVDDEGDVVSFVTPSPDVNLQRYVGRRVGIQGARGFMPDYHRSHVTASRVNMLGTTRR